MTLQENKDYDSQSVYSPMTLAIYDTLVLRISNPAVWRCPTPRILALYDTHVSANHLDVGVGTGWYLDHCRFPAAPRLALMDLNRNALTSAAKRVERYAPETHVADVLQPVRPVGEPFASIGLTYLLHCLPGDMAGKSRVFDHMLPLLAPGGVVFGATILAEGVQRSGLAVRLMGFYNRKGIFGNAGDSLDDLRGELAKRFARVEVTVVGCVALFVASEPRATG
ncbi:MAG: class I SAM-dependent methyltransferase [Luteibacter sp.]|jgi:hypothetical protein